MTTLLKISREISLAEILVFFCFLLTPTFSADMGLHLDLRVLLSLKLPNLKSAQHEDDRVDSQTQNKVERWLKASFPDSGAHNLHMDLTGEIEQLDSGMGSSDMRSPEVKAILLDDEEEYEEDESLVERLVGLSEMFPEEVRNLTCSVGTCLCSCIKGFYSVSCSLTWFFFSSSAILVAPILFEVERAQMEEAQRTQQKQVLLGPNAAISSVGSSGLPMAPPVQR